jgi:hypothetical protein
MWAAGLPTGGPGSGRSLSRAIGTGLIIEQYNRPTLCCLSASERDGRLWHLRLEHCPISLIGCGLYQW